MSSEGFDTLRLWHPEQTELVDRLQTYVRDTTRTPHAVIDERIVSATVGVPRGATDTFLVEMVKLNILSPEYFWICPHTGTTIWNGSDLTAVPPWIRCDACDNVHFYSEQDIELHFIASESLRADLHENDT